MTEDEVNRLKAMVEELEYKATVVQRETTIRLALIRRVLAEAERQAKKSN